MVFCVGFLSGMTSTNAGICSGNTLRRNWSWRRACAAPPPLVGHVVERTVGFSRIFHSPVAASHQSAAFVRAENGGALTRRRYRVLVVHAGCEISRLACMFILQ